MAAKRDRRRWSPDELHACLELYPELGAEATARELKRRGLSPVLRSEAAIRALVSANSGAAERLVEVIRDYRGLPLAYRDLEEELGICRSRIQALALPLVRAGVLERLEGEYGQALLRDPIAWREARP